MSKSERETPSSLAIHLLGPFRAEVDGQAVEEHRWSRRKPKMLVKLLALSGQPEFLPHLRRLAAKESLPASLRSALVQTIYQIGS